MKEQSGACSFRILYLKPEENQMRICSLVDSVLATGNEFMQFVLLDLSPYR